MNKIIIIICNVTMKHVSIYKWRNQYLLNSTIVKVRISKSLITAIREELLKYKKHNFFETSALKKLSEKKMKIVTPFCPDLRDNKNLQMSVPPNYNSHMQLKRR